MLKSLKYQSKITFMYIGGALGVSVAFVLLYRFIAGGGDSAAQYLSGMITGLGGLLNFAVTMTTMAYYNQIALSMGATRKNFFLAAQISKLVLAAGMFATIAINYFVIGKIYSIELMFIPTDMLVILGACLLASGIGDAVGVVCTRFGKLGMYLYIGGCAIFGAVIGFTASMGGGVLSNIVNFFSQNAWYVFAACLAGGIVFTALSAFLNRKSVVAV